MWDTETMWFACPACRTADWRDRRPVDHITDTPAPAADGMAFATADSSTVRMRNLRCSCGRIYQPYDIEITDSMTRLICANCHNVALEIEPRERGDQ